MIEQRRLNGEKRIQRAKKMIPAVEIKQEALPPRDEQNKVKKSFSKMRQCRRYK